MSVQRFNRGQIPQALARFFGLKGDVAVDFQETIVPTVPVGDVVDSPYLLYGVGVMGGNAVPAGGALEFGYVGFRPGANVSLQLHQLALVNPTAAALTFAIRHFSAANTATVGITGEAPLNDVSTGNAPELKSSSSWIGIHTATIGTGLLTVAVAAGESQVVNLPRGGIVLNGTPDRPSVAVTVLTADAAFTVTGYGREWPLPG